MGAFIDLSAADKNIVLEQRRQDAALWNTVLRLQNEIDAVLAAQDAAQGAAEVIDTLSGTSQEREIPSPGSPQGALPVVKANYQTVNTSMHTIQTNLNTVITTAVRDILGGLAGPTAGI